MLVASFLAVWCWVVFTVPAVENQIKQTLFFLTFIFLTWTQTNKSSLHTDSQSDPELGPGPLPEPGPGSMAGTCGGQQTAGLCRVFGTAGSSAAGSCGWSGSAAGGCG